jgi:protein transport protein SEC24
MADYSMYHALGQGEQIDPNDPNRNTQPAPPQFVPPVAQQQHYGAGGPSPPGPQAYGAPQPQQQPGGSTDLAAQMAGMNIADPQHTARRKKKDRHAFHNVEAPAGSSQAFNGIPPAGTSQTAFLNADPSVQAGGQFLGQPVTPNQFANQFPAPVNPAFNPTAASPAEFAARNGAPGDMGPQSAFVRASGGAQVSPDDIPSVPVSRDVPQQYFLNNVYPTFERHVPPPASISYVAFDQGNSAPKFTRLTMNNIPASAEGLKTTGLPLGLIVQPLAKLQPGELEIPVLDFGDQGPPRCRRCRSYINPFMMFRSGGSKFVCNLCTYPNDTPSEYFCATTPQGVRVDRDQRPELSRGTVEFVVPKEYWTKEPVGLNWLFVIDVTQEAFNKGFLEAFCEGILAALYAPEGGEDDRDENGEPKRRLPAGAKVGFVTYDKDIHFYSCHVRTRAFKLG